MKRTFVLLAVLSLWACNGFKSIKAVFREVSPYEQYVESLKKAELINASMAQDWLSAGQKVFQDSVFIDVPFSESGFFQASNPEARSYRFKAKDGQVLTVTGTLKTQRDAKMFIDLFVLSETDWDRVAYGDSTLSITHEFNSNEECLLRLQPELLTNTWYAINISLTPVLINPVFGATNKSIGSYYGASRDNGKRSHEGVDIFAPRGTPVVAPIDGYISRVSTGGLGGKVVWMKDAKRHHSYYFAHLDSQMVKPGTYVRQGHVLGLVGNTGNAKRTPPHLHFGIYQSGSKDPLYYIRRAEAAIASLPLDTGFQQKPLKVILAKADLMTGPSSKSPVRCTLQRDTYVTVIGQSHDWYRISLPDKKEGFLSKKSVGTLITVRSAKVDSTVMLFSTIHPAVPMAIVEENTPVEVMAQFAEYNFVVTEKGKAGWINTRIKG